MVWADGSHNIATAAKTRNIKHKLNMDTKDWKIDTSVLKAYKKGDWSNEYFSQTLDEKYGIFMYNIDEFRMLSYAGLIAIFQNNDNPGLLVNSCDTWIWFDNDKTFDYAPLSECIIFRKPAFRENAKRPGFPFILVKPAEKKFAFIEWDETSIYYGFNEAEKDRLIVKEVHSKDLNYLGGPKRTHEIVDISNIAWFDIERFDKALDIYHERR